MIHNLFWCKINQSVYNSCCSDSVLVIVAISPSSGIQFTLVMRHLHNLLSFNIPYIIRNQFEFICLGQRRDNTSAAAAAVRRDHHQSITIVVVSYISYLSLYLSHTHIWTEYDAVKRTRACATFINNATTWENKHTQRIYIELQSQRSFDKLADKSSQTSWKNKQKNTIRWPSETFSSVWICV